ncbi:hypothetical protein MPI44_004593 [Klebsiella oxytoca]|nr:hypothetical protein [Klebsiella oxytoca]
MSSKKTAYVTFTFNGKAPADWVAALTEKSAQASWIDPESPGSIILRKIMLNYPVELEAYTDRSTITVELPGQADALSSLLGMYAAADAKILLLAGCQLVSSLASVTLKTSTLLPSGFAISSEHKAERNLYFMTQNGICVMADSTVTLCPEKLPGATFFATEDEMDSAGIGRWGENGGEGWRTHATVIDGRVVLMNGFGNMIPLGNEPEVVINSINN